MHVAAAVTELGQVVLEVAQMELALASVVVEAEMLATPSAVQILALAATVAMAHKVSQVLREQQALRVHSMLLAFMCRAKVRMAAMEVAVLAAAAAVAAALKVEVLAMTARAVRAAAAAAAEPEGLVVRALGAVELL